MACPKCGCKATYEYRVDDVGEDYDFERCSACGSVFYTMDAAEEDDEPVFPPIIHGCEMAERFLLENSADNVWDNIAIRHLVATMQGEIQQEKERADKAFKAGMLEAASITYQDMKRHALHGRRMTADGCEGVHLAIMQRIVDL